MQRKRLAGKATGARRPGHRRDAHVLEVPTYQPEAASAVPQPSAPADAEDAAAEEAVRRMIEAAYT